MLFKSKSGKKKKDGKGEMTLPLSRKLAYGVGHVLNDLCSAMWFSYTLIWFNKVILFSSSLAGAVVFVGQIADGVATPFVGYFSDRGDDFWFCKYGKRKTWHLVGTICVVLSFPFIFTPCIGCSGSDDWAQMIYYSAFVVVFQFGWASVQISHLSLVPDLTPDEHERTTLLAIRNGAMMIANMVVYVTLWIVLQVGGDANAPITPADTHKFQTVAYVIVGIGAVTSIIFHIGTKEESQESLLPSEEFLSQNRETVTGSSTLGLFTQMRLYQVAVLYMGTRLFANISQSIFPLYLHDNLELGGQMIAVLPLVMYAFSFLMSFAIKPINKHGGRKVAFCFGSFVGVAVSIWVVLGSGYVYKTYLIYIVAGMYGITSTSLLVTSLSITADLIGQDLSNGAFIYGVMSFTDKLSNGVFVEIIQVWTCVPSCVNHYRDSLAYVCGGAAVLGTIAVLFLKTAPAQSTAALVTTEEIKQSEEPDNNQTMVSA